MPSTHHPEPDQRWFDWHQAVERVKYLILLEYSNQDIQGMVHATLINPASEPNDPISSRSIQAIRAGHVKVPRPLEATAGYWRDYRSR